MNISPRFLALTALALPAFEQSARAVTPTAPDTADFQNTPVGGSVIDDQGNIFELNGVIPGNTPAGTPWNIVNGSGNLPTQDLQNLSSGGDSFAVLRYQSIQTATGNPKPLGFTESTDFTFSSVTTPGSSFTNAGLGAASNDPIFFSHGIYAQYVVGSTDSGDAAETAGNLVLTTKSGYAGGSTLAYLASGVTPVAGDKYTLSLTDIYSNNGAGPGLSLYVSITDDTTGVTSGMLTSSLASASTGNLEYGYVDSSSGSSTATINYDNYSMLLATAAPVPEPSSWMLLALGLAVIVAWSRRIKPTRIGWLHS